MIRGYFLQNGGYYFAISDYIDLAVIRRLLYQWKLWLRFESAYKLSISIWWKFGFRYENLISSERGFPDYAKNSIYNIRWSHTQDAKANP